MSALLTSLHTQAITPFSLLQCMCFAWAATRIFEYYRWQNFDCGPYSFLPWGGGEVKCANEEEWKAWEGFSALLGLAVFTILGWFRTAV